MKSANATGGVGFGGAGTLVNSLAVAIAAVWLPGVVIAAELRVPQQFATIQAAVNAAANGDVVVVSAGEYAGAVVIQGKGVTIRGVGEVAVDAGNVAASVIRIEQTPAGSEVRLENLVIRGGLGTELSSECWPFGPSRFGGGVFVSQGRLRATGVTVQSNQATLGAGIWYQSGSRVQIDASVIDFNTASEVGAAVAGCWFGEASELIINDSTIAFNALVASGSRFGILATGLGSAEVRGTIFENNSETLSIIQTPQVASTNLTVVDSTFRNNSRLFGSMTVSVRDAQTQTLIERCRFEDETGPDGNGRSAIFVTSAAPGSMVIRDCHFQRVITGAVDAILLRDAVLTIEDCRIRDMPDAALGVFAFGGSQARLSNVQSQDSSAGFGLIVSEDSVIRGDRLSVIGSEQDGIDVRLLGGRVQLSSTLVARSGEDGISVTTELPEEPSVVNRLELVNVTLTENFIGLNPQAASDGTVDLVNCIIAGNAGANLLPSLRPEIPTIRWSLIQEVLVPGPNFGPGIVNVEPRFVNPVANDFRLAADSRAVDAGDAGGILSDMTRDLAGQARRVDDAAQDQGTGGAPLPDLGAFERVTVTGCSGADLASEGAAAGGDGILDNNDFVRFIQLFFDSDVQADIGAEGGAAGSDGAWDNNDFIVFIGLFFEGC